MYDRLWRFKRWVLNASWFLRFRSWASLIVIYGIVGQGFLQLAGKGSPIAYIANLVVLAVLAFCRTLLQFQWVTLEERPTPRELHEVLRLQEKLRKLRIKVRNAANSAVLEECLDRLTEDVFNVACQAICAQHSVRVTFMQMKGGSLQVVKLWPESADLDEEFVIPMERTDKGLFPRDKQGAAGFAYGSTLPVYVPRTSTRLSYMISISSTGELELTPLGKVFKKSASRRYRSLVCMPVYVTEGDQRVPLGVLNFESRKADNFSTADFHLALMISGFYAEGLKAIMKAKEELSQREDN